MRCLALQTYRKRASDSFALVASQVTEQSCSWLVSIWFTELVKYKRFLLLLGAEVIILSNTSVSVKRASQLAKPAGKYRAWASNQLLS